MNRSGSPASLAFTRLPRPADGGAAPVRGDAACGSVPVASHDEARDELRQGAAALQGLTRRPGEGAREREMMLATMAHDLRSPLARIQAAIELRARPDEDWAPVLCDVQEIDHLIGQCIDYVRDGQDEPTLMISVDALLRALVRVPEDAAVELDLAAPQALPLRRQLLSRAVRNLVDNARRHGSAPIRLNTRLEADAVLLTVEDQGPGIDPRHWERLLKPFEQGARQGRACAAGSAGLGLAIVQRAARQHGGGLSMRPATTGSPFSISLRLPLS